MTTGELAIIYIPNKALLFGKKWNSRFRTRFDRGRELFLRKILLKR